MAPPDRFPPVQDPSPENDPPSPPHINTEIPAPTPESSAPQPATPNLSPADPASAGPVTPAVDPPDRPSPVPKQGRLLGIDYGTKRLGFAVTTPDQTLASPVENYSRRDTAQDGRKLKQIVEDYRIVGIVIGLPVHLSGEESGKSRESRKFGEWVQQITQRPVCYWDERFSSARAEEILLASELTKKRRDARRDMLAAQILLESFLQSHDRTGPPRAM